MACFTQIWRNQGIYSVIKDQAKIIHILTVQLHRNPRVLSLQDEKSGAETNMSCFSLPECFPSVEQAELSELPVTALKCTQIQRWKTNNTY